MNAVLNGKWSYRSFRQDSIVVKDGRVEGTPALATPWSPPGVLEVVTNDRGEVTGTLTFSPKTLTFSPKIVLDVFGNVIPATDKAPPAVRLIGKVELAEGVISINRIEGFFVPDSDHVVGTIMCEQNDPLSHPNGTAGPFVLVPMTG